MGEHRALVRGKGRKKLPNSITELGASSSHTHLILNIVLIFNPQELSNI